LLDSHFLLNINLLLARLTPEVVNYLSISEFLKSGVEVFLVLATGSEEVE
jgi:hypothetical protein